VIDQSNRGQVAAAVVELLRLLKSNDLRENKKPIIIALSKCELTHGLTRPELQLLLRLDDIVAAASKHGHSVAVLECSALTGKGVVKILQRAKEFLNPKR